ncbi:MAG: sensor histidine kinase [Bacteriovoracaceae bacterium]|nr:sensor histidine kinase [Bacteroidota bacterium]
MNDESIDLELNDTTIRIVLIPFFGFVIPNITGMIDNSLYTSNELFFAYLYFTFIAFAIWQGNRYLLFRLRLRFSWLSQPMYKVIALVVSNIFYTIPISVGLMTMWYVFAQHATADWDVIFKATALCVVCVVFITHTYETVFLIKSWGTDKSKSEFLEKAKLEAELEALKNQIDPHFMFNSLNTLSHLIENDPTKAKEFNDNLAEVYRYILSNKDRNLVLLSEEIFFAEKYFSLLRIRFGETVSLTIDPSVAHDDFLIPPISLQILLENAIKHNEFSEQSPLDISVTFTKSAAVVVNALRPKSLGERSSHVGLKNLNERYKLITEQEMTYRNDGTTFTVILPLLKTT